MLPVIALFITIAVFYQFQQQSRAAELALEHSFDLRSGIRRVLAQMLNAETGIRGYLLSRREPFSSRTTQRCRNCLRSARISGDWFRTIRRRRRGLRQVESLISRALEDMQRSRIETARGNQHGSAARRSKRTSRRWTHFRAELDGDAERRRTLAGASARKRRAGWSAAPPW